MTPPTPAPIDLVTVAIAAATLLFGAEVAALVGPYVVILLGAVVGALWSTSRRAPTTRAGALVYSFAIVGTALLVTVPLAELAARWLGGDVRWMLGPVAALVGGIGHDWPKVGRWGVGLLRTLIERKAAGATPPTDGGQQ